MGAAFHVQTVTDLSVPNGSHKDVQNVKGNGRILEDAMVY